MSHTFLRHLSVAALSAGLSLPGYAQGQAAQPQAGQPAAQTAEPQWIDRAEYDLVQSIGAEQDQNKKVQLLDQWTQKYPNTNFKKVRQEQYLLTYRGLNNAAKMMDVARQMLADDPNNPTGLYWSAILTPSMTDKSPAMLESGEKSANTLISQLDTTFAADKKPAQLTAEQWATQRRETEAAARRTLVYIYNERKNTAGMEEQYKKLIELNPNDATIAYALGGQIMQQKNVERYPEALFYIGKAVAITGPGELPANVKGQARPYFERVYNSYTGGKEGLDEFLTTARSTPLFDPNTVKLTNRIDKARFEKEQEDAARAADPMLYVFKDLKATLLAEGGAAKFQGDIKGAELPQMKGKIVSLTPATRPTTLVLATEDATTPQITLKLESPLPGKAEPGTEIRFTGVAESFQPDPFMVTMTTEPSKVSGWPVATGPAKPAGAKRPAPRRRR